MAAHKKPASVLKLSGAMQENRKRYKDRNLDPEPGGLPVPTQELTGRALESWQRLVPQLVELKLASSTDSELLTILCQSLQEYHEAFADKEAKYRDTKVDRACKRIMALSSKFGLSPSDRVGLGAITGPPKTKLEQMIG